MSKGEPPSAAPEPSEATGAAKSNTLRLETALPAAPAAPAASDAATDEEPEFDPYRFGKHEFPAGLREKLIATKLRTIPSEELYDTVPPRGALHTPPQGSRAVATPPDTPAAKHGSQPPPPPNDAVKEGVSAAHHAPLPDEPKVIIASERDLPTEIKIRKLDLPLAAGLDTSTINAIEDGNAHEWEINKTQGGSIVDWKVAPKLEPLPERQAQRRRVALGVIALAAVLALVALLAKLVATPEVSTPAATATATDTATEIPPADPIPPAPVAEPLPEPVAAEPAPAGVASTEARPAPVPKPSQPKPVEPVRSTASFPPAPAAPAPAPAPSSRKGGILSKTLQEPPAE